MNPEIFDEELYAIKYRQLVILKIVSSYIRKNFVIGNYEPDVAPELKT